jgi:hypothetical protein
MKLKDLRDYINKLPTSLDETEVILQKDSEGNGYRGLRGVDEDCVSPNADEYEAEIYNTGASAEDNCMEVEEWETLRNDPSKRVIVLFP